MKYEDVKELLIAHLYHRRMLTKENLQIAAGVVALLESIGLFNLENAPEHIERQRKIVLTLIYQNIAEDEKQEDGPGGLSRTTH